MSVRPGLALCLVLAVSAVAAEAQTPESIDCSYDECALRLRHGFWGPSLVRGVAHDEVAGIGLFVGDISDEFDGSPAAQQLVASFSRRHNWSNAMLLLGGIAMTIALPEAFDWGPSDSWSAGAVVIATSGFAVFLAGAVVRTGAQDRLSRAIWEYNRGLGRAPIP